MPKIDPEEAKTYVEAITRIGDLMALASMLPVLFECRFGQKIDRLSAETKARKEARLLEAQKQQGKEARKEAKKAEKEAKKAEKQEEDQEASPAAAWPTLPLGFTSVCFFILAEVVSCWKIFVPSAKAAADAAKGKGKAVGIEGPLGLLIEAVKKATKMVEAALKKGKKSGEEVSFSSSAEKSILVVMESLASREAFDVAHTLLMLVALLAVMTSMLGHYVLPAWKSLCKEGRSQFRCGLCVLVPVVVFGVLQGPSLLKVWKALQAQDLLPSLPRPLRVIALISAAAPGPGKAPELPMFAVLQAGSLMATISAEIARGRLAQYLAVFVHSDNLWKTAMDSRVMTFLVPTLLAAVWVCIVHLRKNKGFLFVAMLASMASSPILIIKFWPKAAPHLGVHKDLAMGLVKVLSVLYVTISFSLLAAGGTLTILSVMFLGNLLVRIHGHEAFAGLLS